MESWRHVNYNTYNTTLQMEYFNASTADWGVGFLPAGVVAVPGTAGASASDLPRTAFVIEHAGETHVGSAAIEVAVFAIASAAVIVWAMAWFLINRRSILKSASTGIPSTTVNPDTAGDGDVEQPLNSNADVNPYNIEGFLSADDFRDRLNNHYYEKAVTEVELVEKSQQEMMAYEPADIEAMAALLREMYRIDMRLNGMQNSQNTSEKQREDLRRRSEAAWEEVTNNIRTWVGFGRRSAWGQEEEALWSSILATIDRTPTHRYPPLRP